MPFTPPRKVSPLFHSENVQKSLFTAVGSYKPSLRNFDYAIENVKEDFGFDPKDILIVANSKYHDVQP